MTFHEWGLDLPGTLQDAGGVGGLFSQTVIRPTANISYFPLADANGNAVTYSDDAGNVQAHYVYDAFGGTVSSDGDMDDDFRFRFSSKYVDDETGLYSYGYRFYDPAPGRWLSRDLIEEQGGILLYSINKNNTIGRIDIFGLQSKSGSINSKYFPSPIPQPPPILKGLPPVGHNIPATTAGNVQEGVAGLPCLAWEWFQNSNSCQSEMLEGLKICNKFIKTAVPPPPPPGQTVLRCPTEYNCCVIKIKITGQEPNQVWTLISASVVEKECSELKASEPPYIAPPNVLYDTQYKPW